jgi:SAM-dependent methyltransferase
MAAEPNLYSQNWFEFFHATIDESRTAGETEFICSCLPLPKFRRLLDLCCGNGRHARELTKRGYSVVGVDRDVEAIAIARKAGGNIKYVLEDIRDYQPAPASFDAAIMMGQSFGHFDSSTNRDILLKISRGLRDLGRIVLDLWNPEFFIANQGTRDLQTAMGAVHEEKRVENDRLFVHLEYPDGSAENFQWQLFSPDEMKKFSGSADLILLGCCNAFDTSRPVSSADPRIQFICERQG